jgi:cytochrome c biogenesis protein CcdA
MTVIGGVTMTGFNPQTEEDIRRMIDRYSETPGVDIVQKVIDGIPVVSEDFDLLSYQTGDLIWIPFLGKVPIETVSLGAAAFFLGLVDGFNPCAMWILLLLITLLSQEKDRKRMWILGSVFLLTSALMYFLVMAAWVRLVWSVADLLWVRVLIGSVALGFGGWNLVRLFRKPPSREIGCEVTGTEQKKKTILRIREILAQKSLWLALGGIVLLAISVNAVELACSAGLPLLFSNLLAFHQVAEGTSLALIGLYVFFFLLDDLVVFGIAVVTLKVTGITNRYSRISQMIGGVIMMVLGFLLIFFPQWLFLSF